MKKLFKEVWKSFSKSKVMLAGLIILIFLTSGIITLIFDVVNSYKTQYNIYKENSVLQDVTMNTNFNLFGSAPTDFYKNTNEEENKNYKNTDNLLKNQWTHEENKSNYIDYIKINTDDEYIKLKSIVPSITEDYFYVKTQDLSIILNANLSGRIIQDNGGQNDLSVKLDSDGNNNLQIYINSNGEEVSVFTLTQISEIYDTYDENTKSWTASRNPKNLYYETGIIFKQPNFDVLLVDKFTKKVYAKRQLEANKNSAEYIRYNSNKNLFHEISSDIVRTLLGFDSSNKQTLSTWILEGTPSANGTTAQNFFKSQTLPLILNNFSLIEPITIYPPEVTLSDVVIPSSWFAYSQYNYIFTKHNLSLVGIDNKEINQQLWSGYYYEYLNNLKESDIKKFDSLSSISYWTKDIIVKTVDFYGNEIKNINEGEGQIDNSSTIYLKDTLITASDLDLEIKNNKTGLVQTISTIEGVNSNDENATILSTNLSASNEEQIKQEAQSFKYKSIYNQIKDITSKIGIRETLTVNSNENGTTNVYQFINLGNSNNELNWNGIDIKQEVGKLTNTSTSSDIFTLPSNINAQSERVPLKYVSLIIEKLLSGFSLNRDYINPMISFNSFSYINSLDQVIETSSSKIIWMTKDGAKDLSNVYGISFVFNEVENKKQYFILKSDITAPEIIWNVLEVVDTFDELDNYIITNNLYFAPFDFYGNDMQIVSDKGWAMQDSEYLDKYSIPFQYLLPNSDIINDFNSIKQNNTNGLYGMEIFRDNLIKYLTVSIKPLIPGSLWVKLTSALNTAFGSYGFGEALTPPAELTTGTIVKVCLGIFRDAITNSNEAFMNPLLTNILNGIKRSINPDGNTSIEIQKENLRKNVQAIQHILLLTIGSKIDLNTYVDLITDPTLFIEGLIQTLGAIDLDKTVIEVWNKFYGANSENESLDKILGSGDFIPYIYKNIYSIPMFKQGIKMTLQATTIGNEKAADFISSLIPPNYPNADLINIFLGLLGNKKVYELVDMVEMENQETGYQSLVAASTIKDVLVGTKTFKSNVIKTNAILSLFTVKYGIISFNLGSLGIVSDTDEITIYYDPTEVNALELDMDLLWYLNNFAFKEKSNSLYNSSNELTNINIFGIDPAYFLHYAVTSFTEIRDDYNQITMTENSGKIAIVNDAFLEKNNKEVYQSNNLENQLDDLTKIDDKYKLDINGVEYVIIGSDLTVDYMYPVINSENITVNTKNQALVYVNQYGFDRIRRSNASAQLEKYFLFTTKDGMTPLELQTELNNIVYTAITGSKYSGTNINDNSNIYKLAYLTNESSLLNPERALRITIIEKMISSLEKTQMIIGIMMCVIVALVIMFVVRRYIGSRAKVIGILKAQGYSSWEIAGSICLFPLFVSLIGSTFGYVMGLVSQYGLFNLFSIFWTMPIVTISFNWITFLVTLISPIILLSCLTIATTFYFLHKNKALAMMNGSMEVNNSIFANKVNNLVSKTSVKNKFSVALALGSIGKLIALFISALFTSFVTLFFVVQFNSFNKSINYTFENKNYKYLINYTTPTIEGGNVKTYYPNLNGEENIDFYNTLYVPVGAPEEGYVYYANYFKPGYNNIINKDNLNGNIPFDDTTTPHIFTKSSIDMTVEAGGLSINVWKNLYNAIPESQRTMIINASEKASLWLEWTQEGKEIEYKGKKYITRFVNANQENEYLSLWDNLNGQFLKIINPLTNVEENIKINYFNYDQNLTNPENSKFIYRISTEDNSYYDLNLIIDGKTESMKHRESYRSFLVNGYTLMFNYEPNNDETYGSMLSPDLRSKMPEYSLDFFITPGGMILTHDFENNSNDETFTYINAYVKSNESIQMKINGFDSNSKYMKIIDDNGNNLIEQALKFNEKGTYPLIINKVVSEKYKLEIGDELTLVVENTYTRYWDKLKDQLNLIDSSLNLETSSKEFKFKVIGINNTYINEEWTTAKKIANQVLNLDENSYNGTISNSSSPISIANSLPLYSYNGYWSADNKIFTTSNVNNLSDSELQKLINTYRQIFYNVSEDETQQVNNSLMATWLKELLPLLSNNEINNLIKRFLGLDDLDITYSSNGSNYSNASKANNAIKKFTNIYTDNALYGYLDNATANGIEKEYIVNASSTINDGLTIVIIISFIISLTILVIITSMIINENERNIAIFGILGYTNKEKIRMFFSIYIPIVFASILFAILIVWLTIPTFLSTILATTSILLPINLSLIDILITLGITSFIFATTCMIAWFVQGRVKPIMLLKGV